MHVHVFYVGLLNRSRCTGYGIVYLDLIRLLSSRKCQARRIEGAIAIMHVHGGYPTRLATDPVYGAGNSRHMIMVGHRPTPLTEQSNSSRRLWWLTSVSRSGRLGYMTKMSLTELCRMNPACT